MGSREEILADFQACTGIEDIEIAICHLEAANWVLMEAVNSAMNDSLTGPHSSSVSTVTEPPPAVVERPMARPSRVSPPPPLPPPLVDLTSRISQSMRGAAGVSLADDYFAIPSSSTSQRTRMLEFNIQYKDRMIHLKVPDNEDIRTLKTLIQTETGVAPCSQDLRGFSRMNTPFPITDRRKLSEMNLPKENILYLVTDEAEEATNGTGASEEELGDFKLTITDERTNQSYTLNYPPTKTVLNVKMDTNDMTNIAVSKQQWTGWPNDISDELSLAQIGIPRRHQLSVNLLPGTSSTNLSSLNMPIIETGGEQRASRASHRDSESDFEEIHPDVGMEDDDDDDMFLNTASSSRTNGRLQPLLPDDFGDETLAAIRFGEEFVNRYGTPHPQFFPGSLDQAIKESCLQPAKERKMLAVYLHHDASVLTNVFCTQALCADTVCHFLNENFINFGWDLTYSSNRDRAVEMITRHFGSVAALGIKNMDIEKFPMLILVYRLGGTTEIFQMIHGNVTLDELMSRLLSAFETYQSQIVGEIREEDERIARDAVKREQDLAFEMSLVADREKEAQRAREERERKLREQEEELERRRAEQVKAEADAAKERKRIEILRKLPPEPEIQDGRKIATIRFRISITDHSDSAESKECSWKCLERRFLASEPLSTLFNFLTSEGFPPEEYKVISSWPRRELTQLEWDKTLEELKLFPQETLTVEEK